jgi:hypothetical protein
MDQNMPQTRIMTSILIASLIVFFAAQNAFALNDMSDQKHDWSVDISGEVFGIIEYRPGHSAVYLVSWNRGQTWRFTVPFGAPLTALGCGSLLVALTIATFAAIRAVTRNRRVDHEP